MAAGRDFWATNAKTAAGLLILFFRLVFFRQLILPNNGPCIAKNNFGDLFWSPSFIAFQDFIQIAEM